MCYMCKLVAKFWTTGDLFVSGVLTICVGRLFVCNALVFFLAHVQQHIGLILQNTSFSSLVWSLICTHDHLWIPKPQCTHYASELQHRELGPEVIFSGHLLSATGQ